MKSGSNSFAIITIFTPDFLKDFKLFYKSLRKVSKVPVIAIAVEYENNPGPDLPSDLFILWLSKEEQEKYRNAGERWMQWFKPTLIKTAMKQYEIDTAIWFDADIIVLDDIKAMFEQALIDFFVMKDTFAPLHCLNDNLLYDEFRSQHELTDREKRIALNSGVIGIQFPRDEYIIEEWENRTIIATSRDDIKEYISLYDQGTLLWTMRDLNILNKVIDKPEWNHNAKRNAYEYNKIEYKWPYGVSHMGGDLFDQVKYDNQNVTIAHYAGIPKLSHLSAVDSKPSQRYRNNLHHDQEPIHVFGVGLERTGTHSLAEILRRSSRYGSWIRHEYSPALSYAAHAKWKGEDVDETLLLERYKIYNRTDVQFIAEINHRLGFFIKEIKENVHNAKFILSLRNPIDLIRSRLRNFSYWSSELNKFPMSYQFDVYNAHVSFGDGSSEQNLARIKPENWNASPIEMHVWEVTETLRYILNSLQQLPDSEYRIIWVEEFKDLAISLREIIPLRYMRWNQMAKWSKTTFGMSVDPTSETMIWIEEQLHKNSDFIINSIIEVLQEFNIPIYERQFI